VNVETYAQFSARLNARLTRSRMPASGTIEVTRRCPLECSHCYNNLPMGDPARHGELTTAEHIRILDEIADAGCLWLLFTGGEVFARKDFIEIYGHAKRRGFIITLFTNGTLITPAIADYLAEHPPFSIEITLYGRTRETYERLTQIPGSYDRCLRGIALLKQRSLPLKVKSVAVSVNKHEMDDMADFVENELGLPFKFDPMINARIDCSQTPLAVRLRPEEIVELDVFSPARKEEWERFASVHLGPAHAPDHFDELYHCGGGVNTFAIDPEGKMSICVLSQVDKWDLRKGSFHDGWTSFLSAVRAKKTTRVTKCTHCELKAMCGMCPATAHLESGDAEEPIDHFCQTAHLRALTLGMAIPAHGECAYCEGGTGHAKLVADAAALLRGERTAGGGKRGLPIAPPPVALGVGRGCGSGGCSSCS
jgi:radical SAM protein with 4Fe4S-binding SPASM domain